MFTTDQELPPALVERLGELSDELGRPIHASYHGGAVRPERVRGDAINLALYAYDGEYRLTQHCIDDTDLWDVLRASDGSEPTTPVCVDEQLVGEIRPSLVLDYVGLHRYGDYELPTLWDAICEAIKLSVDGEFIASAEEREAAAQRAALEAFVRAQYRNQVEAHRDEIDALALLLANHQQRIASTTRSIREKQVLLDALLIVQSNDAGATLIREIDLVRNHARVVSIRFSGSDITILTTDDLRLTRDDTGESRWLGQFRVSLNIETLVVNIANLSTPRGGRDHPHVVSGDPCFGGDHNSMYELLGKGELYTWYELLIQYLETLNLYDEYGRYGSYWFDVEDERPLVTEEVAA